MCACLLFRAEASRTAPPPTDPPAPATTTVTTTTPVPAGGVLGLIAPQSSTGAGTGSGRPEPSSLSALLVPGGQQPQFRAPSGKPTITKVVLPTQQQQQAAGPQAELRSGPADDSAAPRSSDLHANSSSMDWYFQNYNRTNLEPFVGPVREAPPTHTPQDPARSAQPRGATIAPIAALLLAMHLVTCARYAT
ncbi:Uncharacterized protein GBIM_00082 [Gryllus bimaculatus]|nr:Uncharacterized protein GBIM_00082 [Gryllus bimaculatus]